MSLQPFVKFGAQLFMKVETAVDGESSDASLHALLAYATLAMSNQPENQWGIVVSAMDQVHGSGQWNIAGVYQTAVDYHYLEDFNPEGIS